MHTDKSREEEFILFFIRGNDLHSGLRNMTIGLGLGLNGVDINPPTPTHQFGESIVITDLPVPTVNTAIGS